MWNGRPSFQRALSRLQDDVLDLGATVERAIERAVVALSDFDRIAARQIVDDDQQINRERVRIEEQAIELIATQQPMARDLRTIVATLAIVTELERIGDYAEGIAKVVLLHDRRPLPGPLADLRVMAETARSMLRRGLVAFAQADASAARAIATEDDAVDALHERVYRELLGAMLADPSTFDRATWLLWVAHNLERSADRVTNICERVVYEATGSMEQMNVSTY
jgi:phosphate transport system protein